MSVIASNKKAFYNYFLDDRTEAGLELQGWEVKSARAGNVSLAESFVYFTKPKDGGGVEAWLKNAQFSPYEYARATDQQLRRDRKLLLKRSQIDKLHKAVATKGVTCIVTKIYFTKRGLAKADVAIARGKQLHDKKQVLKERAIKREAERETTR